MCCASGSSVPALPTAAVFIHNSCHAQSVYQCAFGTIRAFLPSLHSRWCTWHAILWKADLLLRYTTDTGPVAPLNLSPIELCLPLRAGLIPMVANLGDVLRTCDERL